MRLQRAAVLVSVTFCLSTVGCNTPDSVSAFCGSTTSTLAAAVPVLQDIQGSCLRQKNLALGIGKFKTIQSDDSCSEVGKQAEGAIAAAQILSDYFNALNSLATFGTAKAGSDASSLATKTADAVGAGSAAQTAIGSIVSFLTTAATGAYQQKSLNKDLAAVSGNVGSVVDALTTIVQRNYIDQELKREEGQLATRYEEFSQTHTDGETTLDLDDRWHTDEQVLVAKRVSAQNLITALAAIKKGTADLAANSRSIKAKEIPGLLGPYITQIETLIPQIQKGF